jgi:hypothetical protein
MISRNTKFTNTSIKLNRSSLSFDLILNYYNHPFCVAYAMWNIFKIHDWSYKPCCMKRCLFACYPSGRVYSNFSKFLEFTTRPPHHLNGIIRNLPLRLSDPPSPPFQKTPVNQFAFTEDTPETQNSSLKDLSSEHTFFLIADRSTHLLFV